MLSRRCRGARGRARCAGPAARTARRAEHREPRDAVADLLVQPAPQRRGRAAAAGWPRPSCRRGTVSSPSAKPTGPAVRGDVRADDLVPAGQHTVRPRASSPQPCSADQPVDCRRPAAAGRGRRRLGPLPPCPPVPASGPTVRPCPRCSGRGVRPAARQPAQRVRSAAARSVPSGSRPSLTSRGPGGVGRRRARGRPGPLGPTPPTPENQGARSSDPPQLAVHDVDSRTGEHLRHVLGARRR